MKTFLEARKEWDTIKAGSGERALRVALLSTFTIDRLVAYVGAELGSRGLPPDVFAGPYDQIVQECLSDDTETARFRPDVLVCFPRFEELWRTRGLPLSDAADGYAEEPLALVHACAGAAKRWNATLVFVLPAIPETRPLGVGDANTPLGVFAVATAVRERVRAELLGAARALVVDVEEAVRTIGSQRAYNARMNALAHIPFSEELFGMVGERVARLVALSRRAARKVVVVDGDGTLWGGVIGEDGVDGVDLKPNGPGAAFLAFQAYLKELRAAGVLLGLASKNAEEDVWAVFERPDMILRKADFAAWRIGWAAKSEGLQAMAAELGLGIDSFVFIDDNPAELAEVSSVLPQVACIRMPSDPAEWLKALVDSGELDRLPPTKEDRARAEQVGTDRLRTDLRAQAGSLDDYLSQLGVEVKVSAPSPAELPRLAQLVMKTNQFNVNGRRRPEAELVAIAENGGRFLVRVVSAGDRFGNLGLVGAYVAERTPTGAVVDTFVLSCRALGRGIDEAMLSSLVGEVDALGWGAVALTMEELPRNQVARAFFAKHGCEETGTPTTLGQTPWPRWVKRLDG